MDAAAGMYLAQMGLQTIDGLGNMWADKVTRKKRAEELEEQRQLEESYRERLLGPGQGGGFSTHLGKVNYLDYFMPAIQSAVMFGATSAADAIQGWSEKRKQKKAEKLAGTDQPVENNVPSEPTSPENPSESLEQIMADVRNLNIKMPSQSSSDPFNAGISQEPKIAKLYPTTGITMTQEPVGLTSNIGYQFGMTTTPLGGGFQYGRKGLKIKLIAK